MARTDKGRDRVIKAGGRRKGSGPSVRVAALVMTALSMLFACGHLAAVLEQGTRMEDWTAASAEHMVAAPLDLFHVDYRILYFAVCIYGLIVILTLPKRELPRAEMKGIEHGSNDFQTEEERDLFLAGNTSPIYPLELHMSERRRDGGEDAGWISDARQTFMRPAADVPPHRKVWRAYLAYLNLGRLSGGRTFIVERGRERTDHRRGGRNDGKT